MEKFKILSAIYTLLKIEYNIYNYNKHIQIGYEYLVTECTTCIIYNIYDTYILYFLPHSLFFNQESSQSLVVIFVIYPPT